MTRPLVSARKSTWRVARVSPRTVTALSTFCAIEDKTATETMGALFLEGAAAGAGWASIWGISLSSVPKLNRTCL
jgi:hypothetical protein